MDSFAFYCGVSGSSSDHCCEVHYTKANLNYPGAIPGQATFDRIAMSNFYRPGSPKWYQTTVNLLTYVFVLKVLMYWTKYEMDDDQKEVTFNTEAHAALITTTGVRPHLTSFAPITTSQFIGTSITTIPLNNQTVLAWPSLFANYHHQSHHRDITTFLPATITFLTDTTNGDPVALVLSGQDPTALTPATNPGGLSKKKKEKKIWFGFVSGSLVRGNSPRHTTVAAMSSTATNPASSRTGSEEEHYALLEWYADPETSLRRRIHEKLAGLSGKDRRAAVERYLVTQGEEMAAENLRRWLGQVARSEEEMEKEEKEAEEEEKRVLGAQAAWLAEGMASFAAEAEAIAAGDDEALERVWGEKKAVEAEKEAALSKGDRVRAHYNVPDHAEEKGMFLDERNTPFAGETNAPVVGEIKAPVVGKKRGPRGPSGRGAGSVPRDVAAFFSGLPGFGRE